MASPCPLFQALEHPASLPRGDVSLVCREGRETAHSLLLAAASPLWREVLGQEEEHYTILLPDTPLPLLRHLLELVYTGASCPPAQEVGQVQLLLASLLPELCLSLTAGQGLVSREQGQEREVAGYCTVGQTEHITSWARQDLELPEEEEEEEQLPPPDAGETEESDAMTVNQNLIMKSEAEKKRDNKCCSVCQKTFLYPKDLKKHELIHQQTFPFRCKLCDKGIRTISNMYKHLRVKHSLTADLKCHILGADGEAYEDRKEAVGKVVSLGGVPPEYLNPKHVMAQGSVGQNKSGAELFTCLVCDKQVTKYALKNHLSVHNGENKFKCDQCPKTYATNSSLANHRVSSHLNVKGLAFKCSGCFRTFRTAKVRDHHQTSCLKNGSVKKAAFECRLCNKMFGYKNNLVAHQRAVHGLEAKKILSYNCKHCKEVLKGKLKLSKHIVTAHPDASGELCDLCGKSFQTEIKLLRHISVHKSRERNLHCSFCPKKFFRKDILIVHEKVHTNPVICKECGKKFPEERYLDNHMFLHKEKTHDCIYCAKSFASEELLTKHYEIHNDLQSHVCSFCMKGFRSKLELKRHKAEHSSDFPLKCHVCHKGFLHDSQLEKHVDVVHSKATKLVIYCQHCEEEQARSGQEQVKTGQELASLYSLKRHLTRHKCSLVSKAAQPCEVCAKDPETYYKLKNHIRINENKKVLPCGHCDKKFKTMQDLTTHSVVHTGQKPYSCQLCGDKFTQKCSLKTHYLRHKQGTVGCQAFKCRLCQKACKTFAALKSHMKSHQGGVAELESKELELYPEVEAGGFPHLVFQAEAGLPLLSLDSSHQFQVTTINIDQDELEGGAGAGGLEGLISLEPSLVGLSRGGLGMEGVAEYKIQIIEDLPMAGQHSVAAKSLALQ